MSDVTRDDRRERQTAPDGANVHRMHTMAAPVSSKAVELHNPLVEPHTALILSGAKRRTHDSGEPARLSIARH